MRTYILKRILGVVPTVLMITLVVFVMMRSVPGDPVVPLLGDAYTEEDAIKVREAYGLNKPVLVQYAIWLGKLVQGDWGTSILSGRPVLQDVLVRLPVTLELVVLSMGVALVIAIPAAIIGALRRNTWADYTATSVAMIGVSIPEFFTGVLLLLLFSVGLGGLLPSSGWIYLPGTCPMMVCGVSLWGNVQHVLMPAIALGIGRAALLTRLGDAVRDAGARHLRHRCDHRARLPAGAGLRPGHGARLRRDQPDRRPDVHVPRSPDPLRLR